MKKIIAAVVATLLIASFAVPAIAIDDGMRNLPSFERGQANEAIDEIKMHLSSSASFYKLYTTAFQVEDVSFSGDPHCPYVVVVKSYRLLGRAGPTYVVEPGCDTVVEA